MVTQDSFFLSLFLSFFLSFLSVCHLVCPTFLSVGICYICLFVILSVCLFVLLSVGFMFVSPSVFHIVSLFICTYLHLVCLSVLPSLIFYVFITKVFSFYFQMNRMMVHRSETLLHCLLVT
jgi:hypothetical protein